MAYRDVTERRESGHGCARPNARPTRRADGTYTMRRKIDDEARRVGPANGERPAVLGIQPLWQGRETQPWTHFRVVYMEQMRAAAIRRRELPQKGNAQ